MMRIRTVKPGLFLHEGLFECEMHTKLPIRLAWIGLFCVADREGRFAWRPRKIKAQIFPYDNDIDFEKILEALADGNFLIKYQAKDGEFYGAIPSWESHQRVNAREAQSQIPAPDQSMHVHARAQQCNARGEGKGKERKGKEGNGVGAYNFENCPDATAALHNSFDPDFDEEVQFGDEEPAERKESTTTGPTPITTFTVIDELAKDSTLSEVLKNISTDVQKKWANRYEISWLKKTLLNAIHYHLEKENAKNPAQIVDWGLRLGKWLRREKKPHLLEYKRNLTQELEDFEAQLSQNGGLSHGS